MLSYTIFFMLSYTIFFMLSYTIFFMLNICFDSLLVSNEVKNVFPASGVYKNMNYLANGWL